MTIEKELADNTAAVKALTEVMREVIAAVGCSSLSALPSADVRATQASCQPSVYGPASPAEEAAAVAHADGLTASVAITDEPQAPAPAPAPAPAAPVAPAPAPAAPTAPAAPAMPMMGDINNVGIN